MKPMTQNTLRTIPSSPWVPSLLLGILIGVGYGNSIHHEFHFDDIRFILKHPFILELSQFLQAIFRADRDNQALSHYLAQAYFYLELDSFKRIIPKLTFAVNYTLEGSSSSTGYHLVNITIHWINALLVFHLLKKLLNPQDSLFALLGAVIFAWHPLQTNSVTYILQRNGLLATTFYLGAFLAYLHYEHSSHKGKKWTFISALLYALAVFSKEMAITFPLVCLLYHGIMIRKDTQQLKRYVKQAGYMLSLFLLAGVFASYLFGFWDPRTMTVGFYTASNSSLWVHFLSASEALMSYWRLMWFPLPSDMSIDHFFPLTQSIYELSAWISLIFHGGLMALALVCLHKNYVLIGFGFLWFYITLSPYLIVPEREVMVEYKTYLPMVGWVFVVTEGVNKLWDFQQWKNGTLRKISQQIVVAGFLCFLLYGTWQRNAVFATDVLLWEDTLKKSPQKARVHHNLAVAYHHARRYEEAIKAFNTTIEMEPRNVLAYKNLAACYEAQGQYDQAIFWFSNALQIDPHFTEAQLGLGNAYFRMGWFQRAVTEYEKVLSMELGFRDRALKGMIHGYLRLKERKKAKYVASIYLQLNPGDPWAKSIIDHWK